MPQIKTHQVSYIKAVSTANRQAINERYRLSDTPSPSHDSRPPLCVYQAIEALYPRIVLDLSLLGDAKDCEKTLSSLSCLRFCKISMYSTNMLLPMQTFSLESFHKQANFESLALVGSSAFCIALLGDPNTLSPLRLQELRLSDKISCDGKTQPADYFDLDTICTLSLRGFQQFTSVWQQSYNTMPNLKSINLFGVEHSDTGNFAHIMNDSQFSVMQALFSSAKLREISFHNFSQALPWLDLVSNSGSTLQQLSMHTWPYHWGWAHFRRLPPKSGPVPSWRDPQIRYLELDEQSGSTYGIQYLQLDQQPGFTYAELLRLSSLCPNIEKLGFDIHGMGVEDAVSHISPHPFSLLPPSVQSSTSKS